MNRVASARSPSSRLADWLLPPPPGGRGGVLARLAVAADGFFVNLESLGDALGLPAGWDDTAVRRQVIKTVRKLSRVYRALEVQWVHGADAWVALPVTPGPTLEVPVALLEQAASPQENSAVSYLRLKRLDLAQQGIALETLRTRDLVALTGLHRPRLKSALRALAGYKAVPFPGVPGSDR